MAIAKIRLNIVVGEADPHLGFPHKSLGYVELD